MRTSFPTRMERADALVTTGEIVRSGAAWLVPSQNSDAVYRVEMTGNAITCTCPDHQRNRNACKHILAAAKVAQQEMSEVV